MKKCSSLAVVMILSLLSATPSIAGHGDGSTCPLSECRHNCQSDKSGTETQCPINAKILKKSAFFIENKDAIGLSEDQIWKIKSIQAETRKKSIRQNADMQIFEIELWQLLGSKPAGQEAANAMIDQASAGWGSEAKASIQSYLDLKAVLTDAQMTKAKALWGKK